MILFIFALAGIIAAAFAFTAWKAHAIEAEFPNIGELTDVGGYKLNALHIPKPLGADLPPIVFIHGASANLKDQMLPLRPLLEGRAEMLFFDRPGFGLSGRGAGNNEDPSAQASTIAALMDRLGMKKAVIVGHSFGGAVTTAFGREHADKTLGLVFLSPATHPWPGGATSWYYDLSTIPLLGRLFSETLTYPAGTWQMAGATTCVFSPNKVPDNYLAAASIPLVLRPSAFRANATDVAGLYRYALAAAPHYSEIKAPTVVISGDRDKVVYARIHSVGLVRDIEGAELVWVHNLGHKPDWIAADLVVGAIEKVAGREIDLQAMARTVEARIAGDAYGAGRCADITEPKAELAPT
jgi:pimeloyl-ACP methyl ester carboxylesterase